MQYNTSFWIQQCEVRYQLYQELHNSFSREQMRHRTYCYRKGNQFVSSKLVMFNFLTFYIFS